MGQWLVRCLDKLMPHPHDTESPCPHMKTILSDLSDDTSRGIKRWYAVQHVIGCPGCARTLERLKSLRNRLHRLYEVSLASDESSGIALSPEHRAEVESAWARLDSRN
jgi:hypothetical protein